MRSVHTVSAGSGSKALVDGVDVAVPRQRQPHPQRHALALRIACSASPIASRIGGKPKRLRRGVEPRQMPVEPDEARLRLPAQRLDQLEAGGRPVA